jgi:hypothetical protein
MEEPDYFDEIPQIGISDSQEAALTNEDSDYEEKRKRKQRFFDKQKADWDIKVKGKKARKEDLKKDSGIIYDVPIVNNDSTTQLWRRIQNEPPEKVRAASETLELFSKKPDKGGRTRKLRRVKRRKTRKLRETKKVRQTKNARKTKRIKK